MHKEDTRVEFVKPEYLVVSSYRYEKEKLFHEHSGSILLEIVGDELRRLQYEVVP
jgi:hypothetical protein